MLHVHCAQSTNATTTTRAADDATAAADAADAAADLRVPYCPLCTAKVT